MKHFWSLGLEEIRDMKWECGLIDVQKDYDAEKKKPEVVAAMINSCSCLFGRLFEKNFFNDCILLQH